MFIKCDSKSFFYVSSCESLTAINIVAYCSIMQSLSCFINSKVSRSPKGITFTYKLVEAAIFKIINVSFKYLLL